MTNTTATATTTRPYGFHANCSHDASKKARRQCRDFTRIQLDMGKEAELVDIAKTVNLPNATKTRRDDLVYRLSFAPAVREAMTIYG